MPILAHNPPALFPPYRGYVHGVDPTYDEANARMRAKQLGSHRVSSTVVCCQLLESGWKLEIEAVAAAPASPPP